MALSLQLPEDNTSINAPADLTTLEHNPTDLNRLKAMIHSRFPGEEVKENAFCRPVIFTASQSKIRYLNNQVLSNVFPN